MRPFSRLLVVMGSLIAAQTVGVDAGATPSCIAVSSQCYASLPDALAAAEDGDIVHVPAGTFPGGVRITTSITLVGAGAEQTILAGGGPVLTIGTLDADTQPTVTVQGITLTGGLVTSSPVDDPWIAAGGGLQILPSSGGRLGGTVTVIDSVIRDNRAEPATQLTQREGPDVPICPEGPCPFAGAFGAGIDNLGDLTLRNTLVAGNTVAGALTSDADGGGINTGRFFGGFTASLTLDHSTVSGNRALAGDQWGRFAEGGGIFTADDTSLTLQHSSVTENEARLETNFPGVLPDGTPLEVSTNSGGVHVGNGTPVTVVSSHIDRNVTALVGPNAQDAPIDAGMLVGDGRLVMRDSTVNHNVLSADVQAAPDLPGGAFEWDGVAEITGSEFVGNLATITARDGDATSLGAVDALAIAVTETDPGPSVMRHSVIRDNLVTLVAPRGNAAVFGGGMTNNASTVLDEVRITGNGVVARSLTATLQGGGIWNGALYDDPPGPPSQLTLSQSRVENNVLSGPPGAVLQGGGLYTEVPVTLQQTRIENNIPDQCAGC
jgi:hypothetical protein